MSLHAAVLGTCRRDGWGTREKTQKGRRLGDAPIHPDEITADKDTGW